MKDGECYPQVGFLPFFIKKNMYFLSVSGLRKELFSPQL